VALLLKRERERASFVLLDSESVAPVAMDPRRATRIRFCAIQQNYVHVLGQLRYLIMQGIVEIELEVAASGMRRRGRE
jgi:hypothetical protein